MKNLRAKDVMNPNVLTVADDLPLGSIAAFFADNEISGAPVVNADGRLVGVVSLTDLARWVTDSGHPSPDRSDPGWIVREWDEYFNPEDLKQIRIEGSEPTARDLMSPRIDRVGEKATIAECATLMRDHHTHRLLVTEEDRLLGIITTYDLLSLLTGEA